MKKYNNVTSETRSTILAQFGNFSIFKSLDESPFASPDRVRGWKLQRTYRELNSDTNESEPEFTDRKSIARGTLNNIDGWFIILGNYVLLYAKTVFPIIRKPEEYIKLISVPSRYVVEKKEILAE